MKKIKLFLLACIATVVGAGQSFAADYTDAIDSVADGVTKVSGSMSGSIKTGLIALVVSTAGIVILGLVAKRLGWFKRF